MKKSLIILLMAVSCMGQLNAQQDDGHQVVISVPKLTMISIMDESHTSSVTIHGQSSEAGHTVMFNTPRVSGYWLNYSSTVSRTHPGQRIFASIAGDIPDSFHVTVEANPYTGDGKGKTGQSNGKKVLSATPSEIIRQIGTCHTGKGPGNGHLLTYALEYGESGTTRRDVPGTLNIRVLYTLSE